jgi:WD40 repeat protein
MKSGNSHNAKTERIAVRDWDYRWEAYPSISPVIHPEDCSIKTFRGHSVLRTLIRCHFSPVYSTGQRYGYTGSANGIVKVYDLLGDDHFEIETDGLVRDLAWHPYDPLMVLGCCQPNKTVVVEPPNSLQLSLEEVEDFAESSTSSELD